MSDFAPSRPWSRRAIACGCAVFSPPTRKRRRASLFTTRPGDVLDEIVAASSDPILTAVYRRMQDQLAPLVALEPSILGPDKADLEEIAAARSDAAKLKDALIRHHRLRIDAAPLLAAALERRGAEPEPM